MSTGRGIYLTAILKSIAELGGTGHASHVVSRTKLKKRVAEELPTELQEPAFRKALTTGLKEGLIVQKGQSYRIPAAVEKKKKQTKKVAKSKAVAIKMGLSKKEKALVRKLDNPEKWAPGAMRVLAIHAKTGGIKTLEMSNGFQVNFSQKGVVTGVIGRVHG